MVITMNTQTLFQAGNSTVVAIPKHLARELNLTIGKKVVLDKSPDGEGLIVKRVKKQINAKQKPDAARVEFDKWYNEFIKENGEILDELATR